MTSLTTAPRTAEQAISLLSAAVGTITKPALTPDETARIRALILKLENV